MNLILFEPAEVDAPLPRRDPRGVHLLETLKRKVGDTFDAGIVNGPRGKGTLVAISDDALRLAFAWCDPPPPADPITVIVGLPRPQTARDILRDATALGVAALHFVQTEKGEASYAQSALWSSGEWRRHLVAGAEQAFDTRIPEVTFGGSLTDALARLPQDIARIALDNYEATASLADHPLARGQSVVLALGAERGWSAGERRTLRHASFALVHLGPRVLRAETAVTASLAIVRARTGLM